MDDALDDEDQIGLEDVSLNPLLWAQPNDLHSSAAPAPERLLCPHALRIANSPPHRNLAPHSSVCRACCFGVCCNQAFHVGGGGVRR